MKMPAEILFTEIPTGGITATILTGPDIPITVLTAEEFYITDSGSALTDNFYPIFPNLDLTVFVQGSACFFITLLTHSQKVSNLFMYRFVLEFQISSDVF